MYLLIDIGNTRVKTAITDSYRILESFVEEAFDTDRILRMVRQHPGLKHAIVSSVRQADPAILDRLRTGIETILVLDHTTPLPFTLLYTTRDTLGNDRVAVVAGASSLFPSEDILVMDFGTAITYDFIDASGVYHGGNISPGMRIRFIALHQFTGRLPLAEESEQYPLLATNTRDAIVAGVQQGIIFEAEKYIENLQSTYPALKVIGTGGDADFFAGRLKHPFIHRPDLIFTGLERILDFSINKGTSGT